jgi:flagellar basal-body rod modification protein FlgD
MASVALALGAARESASGGAAERSAASGAGDKEMFLQLLVAQIRNQNPLEPMEGIEFLTELAQFSALEQLAAIREELASLRAALEPREAASAAGTAISRRQ